MTKDRVDIVITGAAVAFDADTGDVLHVYEKACEATDGSKAKYADITEDEREATRREAAAVHPRRRIDVVVVPPEQIRPDELVRYHVDPMTRSLRVEREPTSREVVAAFRQFGGRQQ